ncbi:MAG: tetratricopeptide repeat protein [Cyanobacteriota bacterium]|nr:tetratricopeptide repeat protein [Cyanobacteriota bacterium]
MTLPATTDARARLLAARATAELSAGRPAPAAEALQAALALDPQPERRLRAELLGQLGIALRQCGDLPAALTAYRQSLAMEPTSPAVRVNLALALRASGALAEATETCRQALRLCPSDAEGWNVLGLLLQEQQQPQAASNALRRALQLNPRHAEALSNLGHLLTNQGEWQAAVAACRRAIALQPGLAEAWNNLAQALGTGHQLGEAIEAGRQALALRTPFPEASLGLALLLRRQGGEANLAEAIELLGQLLAQPEGLTTDQHTLAWEQAVGCFCDRERYQEAWRLAEKALAAGIDSAALQAQLGRTLSGCGRFREAEQAYERAMERGEANAALWLAIGMMHQERGHAERACQAFEQALQLEPGNLAAQHLLAITQMNLGHVEDARDRIEELLLNAPNDPAVLHLACDLLGPDRYQDLQSALTAARRLTPALAEQAILAFAAARLERRHGDPANAMTTLLEANRLQHAWKQSEHPSPPMDPEDHLARVQAAEASALSLAPGACDQPLIFIVGLPRGGSTLLESILACSPAVCPLGELKVLATALKEEPSCAAVAERYLAAAADRLDKALDAQTVLIDKQLGNYQYARIIPHLFPRARIVHVHRNPMDQILSILWELFADPVIDWAYDIDYIVNAYDGYRRVINHLAAYPELPLYHCNYDKLVRHPETEIRHLVEFCQLPWLEAFLHPERSRRMVKTASVLQVRKPIHAGSVGGWRRFEQELRPWAEQLEALGYSTDPETYS